MPAKDDRKTQLQKKLQNDPIFKQPKRDSTKVVIDERFSHMLDADFQKAGAGVDKYGRKKKESTTNELKRFYKLQEPTDLEAAVEEPDEKLDLARGEGVESSDEEFSDVDSDIENLHEFNDLEAPFRDEEIPTGEETRRFAVVNMDWDNIKAKDLFKVFEGFTPTIGRIESVNIYLSDFGRQRQELESINGPPADIFAVEDGPLIQADSGKEFNDKKLREYQLSRLRYYYAVVEADTLSTAKAVFGACDGSEFESSANCFDLRYVPDDMIFETPTETATVAPLVYEPSDFITQALQHSNVKLYYLLTRTWDDEDPERTKITRRKFTKDDLQEMDFKAYLASDSDEHLSDEDEETRKKYQALLVGEESEAEEIGDMEITFTPGLTENANRLMEEKKEKDVYFFNEAQNNETVFETYLRKKKEKKNARKSAVLANIEGNSSDEEEKEEETDPFFQEDFGPEFEKPVETTKPVKTTKTEKRKAKQEASKSKAELELLLMDENKTDNKHFSMKDVMKSEKPVKRKRGKKVERIAGETQDTFEIDLVDPRFTSVVDDHQMAIDPTNSQFKHTKSMDKILSKRRNIAAREQGVQDKNIPTGDLSQLVASVKRKTAIAAPGKGKRQRQ